MTRGELKKIRCFPPQEGKATIQSSAGREVVLCHNISCPGMRDICAIVGHVDDDIEWIQPVQTFFSLQPINPYLPYSRQWQVSLNDS